MAFSIHAFAENNTPDGALQYITPVPDTSIRTEGNYMFIKNLENLIGGQFFGGALPLRAYIESPTLRRLNYFEISPVEAALIVAEAIDYRIQPEDPIPLPKSDALRMLFSATAGAARRVTGIIWLSDGALSKINGEIFHAYCTAAITEVVGAWAHGELVFDQPLPVGRYALVGARCQCVDDGVAFRFISLDTNHRPGGLCVNGEECPDLREQRNGYLGTWLEFEHDSPPELEVIASVGGDAVQNVILDLIKLS